MKRGDLVRNAHRLGYGIVLENKRGTVLVFYGDGLRLDTAEIDLITVNYAGVGQNFIELLPVYEVSDDVQHRFTKLEERIEANKTYFEKVGGVTQELANRIAKLEYIPVEVMSRIKEGNG